MKLQCKTSEWDRSWFNTIIHNENAMVHVYILIALLKAFSKIIHGYIDYAYKP